MLWHVAVLAGHHIVIILVFGKPIEMPNQLPHPQPLNPRPPHLLQALGRTLILPKVVLNQLRETPHISQIFAGPFLIPKGVPQPKFVGRSIGEVLEPEHSVFLFDDDG